MEPMVSQPRNNKVPYVFGLLTVLMVSHLTFLGFKSEDPQQFESAAETYITVILALMAPTPLIK